jgi:nucleotide-binding universal stress UspA family protein
LLAVDGSAHSNRAVDYVVRCASGLRPCEVHLANILPPSVAGLPTCGQNNTFLKPGVESAAARRRLDEADIVYRFHGALGDPAHRLVELARSESCDEVIVGSRGLGALDGFALGSVAYKVVHLSPVPVTVVPDPLDTNDLVPNGKNQVHRILLAVDGSEASAQAITYVCALRNASMPVEVRLLNVQAPISSGIVRRLVSQAIVDAYVHEEGLQALDTATKALQAAGIAFQADIQVGHAAEMIVRQALQRGCTRIVMGTRGHGALASVMLGSTALQVLHRSAVPVTLVK